MLLPPISSYALEYQTVWYSDVCTLILEYYFSVIWTQWIWQKHSLINCMYHHAWDAVCTCWNVKINAVELKWWKILFLLLLTFWLDALVLRDESCSHARALQADGSDWSECCADTTHPGIDSSLGSHCLVRPSVIWVVQQLHNGALKGQARVEKYCISHTVWINVSLPTFFCPDTSPYPWSNT